MGRAWLTLGPDAVLGGSQPRGRGRGRPCCRSHTASGCAAPAQCCLGELFCTLSTWSCRLEGVSDVALLKAIKEKRV